MDIEKELIEKIKRFEDIKNQIQDIQTKIGGLQEQQRAIYNKGLELKGQIDLLVELQEKEKAASPLAKLTLPEKTLVASDGKTPITDVAPAAVPQEVAIAPVKASLEVI